MGIYAKNITLTISGVKTTQGEVCIALYNNDKDFLNEKKSYMQKKLPAKEKIIYRFKEVPKGVYAIAVFHDKNSNGIVDKNFLGMPKERVGISNNVSHTLSAPSFKEAKFRLIKDMKLHIEVN